MTGTATRLAGWAAALVPTTDDLALAQRSLVDTVAVTLAARSHPIGEAARVLSEPGRWGVLGHVLDFGDLHALDHPHQRGVRARGTRGRRRPPRPRWPGA